MPTFLAWLWLAVGLCLLLLFRPLPVTGMSDARMEQLRDETAALFKHGYEGYMKYAYPADELRPLSCAPLRRSPNSADYGINDLHANVSLTLLDVLSTLPLLHPAALPSALERISTQVSFDQDVKVQVFEMTIRALGGLLSMYQYLDDLPESPYDQARVLGLDHPGNEGWFGLGLGAQDKVDEVDVKKYRGRMLELAEDLGKRLLPAFKPNSGIPFARINLRRGVMKGETVETCTAGAGSLMLEFALLSRLTGDDRYEKAAKTAYMSLWNRRSDQNLLGNAIGTHGHWLLPGFSGVGAGTDSFFEYGIKAGVMLGDNAYFDIFYDAYAAIQTHVRTPDGYIYRPIHTRLLQPPSPSTIDSLSAFLPAVQVLAGDIPSAIKGHLIFWNLWRKHSALPESWDWEAKKIEWAGWPGRPEFVESTYYLYQATKDPFYLRVGERIIKDLRKRTMTRCGFATIKNIITSEMEDRMESFMLSETLKYLYLLFSNTPFPNTNKIYTTEGHPLYLPASLLTASSSPTHKTLHKGEWLTCPAFVPRLAGGRKGKESEEGLKVGVEMWEEYEYARGLIWGWGMEGLKAEDERKMGWGWGVCGVGDVPKYSFDIALTPPDQPQPPEDPAPSAAKVSQNASSGDYIIHDISGLKLGVRWRLDGKGYDVVGIGPHRVRTGQQVIIADPSMRQYLPDLKPSDPIPPSARGSTAGYGGETEKHGLAQLVLRFTARTTPVGSQTVEVEERVVLQALGATAIFGKDLSVPGVGPGSGDQSPPSFKGGWSLSGPSLSLVIPPSSRDYSGCSPLPPLESLLTHNQATPPDQNRTSPREETMPLEENFVLMLPRGGCTFATKVFHARRAGAGGVLFTGLPPPPEDLPHAQSSEQAVPEQNTETEGEEAEGEGEAFEYVEYANPDEGLIRPSADPAELEHFRRLLALEFGEKKGSMDGMGVVYVDHVIGELLRTVASASAGDGDRAGVGVGLRIKLLTVDEYELGISPSSTQSTSPSQSTQSDSPKAYHRMQGKASTKQQEQRARAREGRLAVGEWGICNLMVVDTSA